MRRWFEGFADHALLAACAGEAWWGATQRSRRIGALQQGATVLAASDSEGLPGGETV